MSISLQDAVSNMQVLAERYTGKLAEHMAIGESLSVIRAFVEAHSPKESTGGAEVEAVVPEIIESLPEERTPKKSRKTKAKPRRR